MGTCKLRAGDRRESVIGYRSAGAEASSGGDGLSNYPAGRPAAGQGQPGGWGSRPLPPRGKGLPPAALRGKSALCCARGPRPAWGGGTPWDAPSFLLGRRRMLRTPGAGEVGGTPRTFPFASSRLKIRLQPPPTPPHPPSPALPVPASRGSPAPARGAQAAGLGGPGGPVCRRLHLLAAPAPAGETRARSYHVPLVYSSRCREQQRLFLLQLFPNFSPARPSGGRCPSCPLPVRVCC